MAIRNLQSAPMTQFTGKNTADNLTDATPGTMLSAKNVMILADNQVRRAPGYTLVKNIGTGPVYSQFDFERNVDQKQFLLTHSGSQLIVSNIDGTSQVVLSSGESSAPFMFVQNSFNCYASNGVNAYRFYDNAGVLTKGQWGLTASASAANLSLTAGTLTLTFGRRYCYSPVSKYTDSIGVQRVHVGPPSPLSAHSGPISAQIVTLTSIAVFADPQVNFIWIFETSDSPIDTSATFFFAAEITNGTTSYGDALLDSGLDQTRLAPFNNNAAPPSPILTTFQSSVAAVNVSQIRLSGTSLVTLGIPEEAWPLSLFFNIPSGSRLATAAYSPDGGTTLMVDTADAKYAFTGYDASTFTEQDSVASPGGVGKFAICKTPFGMAFLSQSQRLWLWKLGGTPTEISGNIAQAYPGTYGMEDLSIADLPNARIIWYSYGKVHLIGVIARTNDAPDANLNLIQLWSIPVKGSSSSGQLTGSSSFYNQIGGLYQTDKIPLTSMTSAVIVKVSNQPFLYLGDAAGNVYRFPDGFQDNSLPYLSSFSSPWSLLGSETKKRFYWLDLYVQSPLSLLDAGGPVNNFHVYAATSESAEDPPQWTELALQLVPSPNGVSQYAIRADMQVDGINVGRYIRFTITFPQDNNDEILLKSIVYFTTMDAA
jgi:hypothetical protein